MATRDRDREGVRERLDRSDRVGYHVVDIEAEQREAAALEAWLLSQGWLAE